MEARDPRSRIRPLPPKTHSGAPPPGPPSPFALRRLGVAVAVAAVVALIALFGVVSARSGNDAAAPATTTTTRPPPIVAGPASTTTTTTTTTTTLPPTLADMAPALTDGLTLVVRDQLSGTVQRWAPGDRAPRPVQLTSRPDRASFDPSGTWLLYETSSGPAAAVHVGGQTSGQP
ncbi:MAG: hypothetical protein ACE5GC_10230, partial [Acidimicrobiia bacterium]